MDKHTAIKQRTDTLIRYLGILDNNSIVSNLTVGNTAPAFSTADREMPYFKELKSLREDYEREVKRIVYDQINRDQNILDAIDVLLTQHS